MQKNSYDKVRYMRRMMKKENSPVFKGYQIYHNYVRPHMSPDNQTSADKAGIKIEGKNKWITLIQNAKIND